MNTATNQEAQDLKYRQAIRVLTEGDTKRAAELFEAITQESPTFLEAWRMSAHARAQCGDYKKTELAYAELLGLSPNDPDGIRGLSDCYYVQGEVRSAYKTIRRLRGTPYWEWEIIRSRVGMTEPLSRKFLRRSGPIILAGLRGGRDPRFWMSLSREFWGLLRDLPAIKTSGFKVYLSYLRRVYLENPIYKLPICPCDLCGCQKRETIFFHLERKVVRCRECGLETVERKPPDGRDIQEAVYDRDETLSEMERTWNDTVFQNRWERLKGLLDQAGEECPKVGGRVIEIGCGYGHFLQLLKEKGMRVEGLETSIRFVEAGKERFKIPIQLGTIRTMKVEPNAFNWVLAYHVAEHLDQPSQLFRAANRMLKGGGYLLLETPVPELKSAPLEFKINDNFGYGNPGHMHFFHYDTLEKYLNKFGFELVSTYEFNVAALPSGGVLGRKIRDCD